MNKVIIYLLLFLLLVSGVSAISKPITQRILADEKFPDNGICDDGEYFLIDNDCEITIDLIISGGILTQMWLLRILLLVISFLFIFKSPKLSIFVIIFIGLIAYNVMPDTAPVESQDVIEEAEPISCWGLDIFKNMGGCLVRSNPTIGWLIIAGFVIYVAYNYL